MISLTSSLFASPKEIEGASAVDDVVSVSLGSFIENDPTSDCLSSSSGLLMPSFGVPLVKFLKGLVVIPVDRIDDEDAIVDCSEAYGLANDSWSILPRLS